MASPAEALLWDVWIYFIFFSYFIALQKYYFALEVHSVPQENLFVFLKTVPCWVAATDRRW